MRNIAIIAEGVTDQRVLRALLSTVLGFGKDALARTFVELASKRHVRSLDLTALFAGTQPRDVDPSP